MSYSGMSSNTGREVLELAHIRQSIRDILTTPIGSRVMRRDYGSLLPELIDQPLHGATRLRVMAATVAALIRWEPRIRVTRVTVLGLNAQGAQTIELEAARIDGARGTEKDSRMVALSIPLRGSL